MLNILIIDSNEESSSKLQSSINDYFSDVTIKVARKISENTKIKNINFVIVDLKKTTYHSSFFKVISSKFNSQNIPILFLTNNVEFALLSETWDYLKKPIDIDLLCNKLRTYKKLIEYELELEKEKNFAISIMNAAQCPIFITDSSKILFANSAFLNFFGCKDTKNLDSAEHFFDSVTSIGQNNTKNINLKTFLSKLKKQSTDITIRDFNSNDHFFEATDTPTPSSNLHIVLLKDKTNEILHNQQLKSLIYIDSLTKLPNRANLIEDLQNEGKKINSLALLDINSFKEINDFYGNKVGDFILKSIAEYIKKEISKVKGLCLYKMPTDVYCISNSKLTQEKFTKIVTTILEFLDITTFSYETYEIDAKLTAGFSFSAKNNKLITADIALQAAKKQHKDYLIFYDELDNLKEYQNNMLWTKKLKDAIAKDNIIVYYQPLVNNKSLKVDKYECLVRMIDGDRIVAPFFFLEISKKSNQYTKITKIVVEKSLQAFANLPYDFSINVSYEDIAEPGFLEFVTEQINMYPGISNRVVFEILEDESIKEL